MKPSIRILILAAALLAAPTPLTAEGLSTARSAFQPSEALSTHQSINGAQSLTPRQQWIQAGERLLAGAFSYIHSLDDPMYFPKQLDKTYPANADASQTAKLEGLARTLFVAAPLLKNNPDLTLHGIKVADYYHHQLVSISNPLSKHYIPHLKGGPGQTLLELASLTISMTACPEILWDRLSKQEQDDLAATLITYGEGPTIDSNWMYFNVFILSFLKDHGYKVDEKKMVDWLNKLVGRYRGEGWYNDAPAYDYYSMWAYQSYGPFWVHFYGRHMKPASGSGLADDIYQRISDRITQYQHELVDNYPYMFARDGRMNMWGRSICYRFAAVTPFPILEYANFPDVNYGWLRHIATASMRQFMDNPDFLENGIPTMGFYGPFAPCVQIYSCRGSVFWIGKAFLGLLLPEDSKYWSATENEGPWATDLLPGKSYNRFQPATGLLITNYPNSGASEMRSWCHETVAGDWQKFRSSENYNKLAYNTEFPWMADGQNGEISMNWGTKNKKGEWEVLRLYDFKTFDDDIYRRDAVLETDDQCRYQLADITLADGILRVDRITVSQPTDITLGHYTLPQLQPDLDPQAGFTTRQVKVGRQTIQVYSNGQYELALIPLAGWNTDTQAIYPSGLHPVSHHCLLPQLRDTIQGTRTFVTLQLWKKIDNSQLLTPNSSLPTPSGFTAKELQPVRSVNIANEGRTITLRLADKTTKIVKF